jgi:hypothetical protein
MPCLFCRGDGESSEHMFGLALGHVGVIRDVCRTCNNVLGSEVDVAADLNPVLTAARRRRVLARAVKPSRQPHRSWSLRGGILRTQLDASGKPQIARQYDDGKVTRPSVRASTPPETKSRV